MTERDMSKQTENAGSCEHGMPIHIGCDDCTIGKLVDEINSLKAANADLKKANDRLCEQNTAVDAACAKLEADNAELLEALVEIHQHAAGFKISGKATESFLAWEKKARAAIAKHGGQQ